MFNRIGTRDGVTLSYCHAHARRKFEQIEKASGKGKAKLAVEALRLYRRLYDIERYATDNDLAAAQIYSLRQEKSKPILDEFYTWLTQSQAKTLPKSPIGKAIAYTLSHWTGLRVYLTDGRLKIGRVGHWRSSRLLAIPFPVPSRQTGLEDFPHPAFIQNIRLSLSPSQLDLQVA